MKVPQFIPYIGDDEYKAIKDCFDSKWITEGPKAEQFNQQLCKIMNVKYGVFAPNGTLALYLGLRALGIGRGDEVIVPDLTFIASANAIEMTGATSVFADVEPETFQIDILHCSSVITKKTKAIMPVHLYGVSADMDKVMKFARHYRLKVIEDAAQAIGVYWNNIHCGTIGDIGCFSFFADKTITTGEGGFVVTNNEETYHKLLCLRNQGRVERGTFIHPEIGYNFRMTDLQLAVGIAQLNKLDEIVDKKLCILRKYNEELSGISEITFLQQTPLSNIVPFRVCIVCFSAHELMRFMELNDIECRTFFYPLHKQPAYANKTATSDKFFPNAIYGYEHGVCLPTFPSISDLQIKYVCDTIRRFYHYV